MEKKKVEYYLDSLLALGHRVTLGRRRPAGSHPMEGEQTEESGRYEPRMYAFYSVRPGSRIAAARQYPDPGVMMTEVMMESANRTQVTKYIRTQSMIFLVMRFRPTAAQATPREPKTSRGGQPQTDKEGQPQATSYRHRCQRTLTRIPSPCSSPCSGSAPVYVRGMIFVHCLRRSSRAMLRSRRRKTAALQRHAPRPWRRRRRSEKIVLLASLCGGVRWSSGCSCCSGAPRKTRKDPPNRHVLLYHLEHPSQETVTLSSKQQLTRDLFLLKLAARRNHGTMCDGHIGGCR